MSDGANQPLQQVLYTSMQHFKTICLCVENVDHIDEYLIPHMVTAT